MLVNDTCADIVRVGHFNADKKRFTGKFKDVSKLNSTLLLAQGSYDENGLKQGPFIIYYASGNLYARGDFNENLFSGKWDFFYPTGKPSLSLQANGSDIKIMNTWNEDGKKVVDNGAGPYESIVGAISWSGKLVAGKPDGKWAARGRFYRTQEVLASEQFKYGEFQKGKNMAGDYKDSSHILLITMDILALTKAENLVVSAFPCGPVKRRNIVNAFHPAGEEQFRNAIRDHLEPVLSKTVIGPFSEPIQLNGKILEDGRIKFTSSNGTDRDLISALIVAMNGLPSLKPATVDGKAVQQDLQFTINRNNNLYSFTYRLLPIIQNQ
ncbi:MAG: hypothetical protein JWR18_4175 [Segetibacter sp.]|nr:hypothetical protein [Segetibacter sp.]